ncbi:hypothetical protein [Mariniphaga sediminis]|uniref:hypothetical protein n=1 Tax=Mariniphaga sediminis TaxID=1628158 RepID=UPI00356A833D
MKKRDLITLVLLSILPFSCVKPRETNLHFINNTNYTILVYDWYSYPDTNFYFEWGGWQIPANSQISMGSKNGWDNNIMKRNNENVLMLFVVHEDTLKKYSFEQISQMYLFSKRYDLHLSDLESSGWTVTYPPN